MEETGRLFFNPLESGKGWEGVKMYVQSETSPFDVQITDALQGPKLSELKTIQGYAEYMANLVNAIGAEKCTFEIKAQAFDAVRNIMMIYAVFGGKSDYVYA